MSTGRCPRCRRAVPPDAAFCASCGASLGAEVTVELDDGGYGGPATEVTFESGGGRGRWIGAGVVTALVVAIGASVLSGGGGGGETAPSTTAPARPTTTAAPPSSAATTAPDGTTTTTWLARLGDGGPLLDEPTGLRLLLAATDGIHRLDLDTGELTIPGGESTFPAEDVQAVPGGYVLWSNGALYTAPSTGRAVPVDARMGGQLVGRDAEGAAWIQLYGNEANPLPSLARIARVGAPLEAIALPWLTEVWSDARPDGLGGVVASVAGGVLRAPGLASPPEPLAPGTLADVVGRFVLTRSCYPGPGCELRVTDVGDGSTRTIDDPGGGQAQGARVSPDGAWVLTGLATFGPPTPNSPPLVARPVGEGRPVTIELPADAPVRLNGWNRSVVAWSDDGRWLFLAAGSRTLGVWRAGSDEIRRIELPSVQLMGSLSLEAGQ